MNQDEGDTGHRPQSLLSVAQVAIQLGTTTRTIQRWVKAGKFPGAFKLNPQAMRGAIVIPATDVEAVAASGTSLKDE